MLACACAWSMFLYRYLFALVYYFLMYISFTDSHSYFSWRIIAVVAHFAYVYGVFTRDTVLAIFCCDNRFCLWRKEETLKICTLSRVNFTHALSCCCKSSFFLTKKISKNYK